MADLGPWMITARNKEHAEYLVRSRAEQRGVHISSVDASGGEGDMWLVSVVVTDSPEEGEAARLGDDTQVLHFDTHRRAQGSPAKPQGPPAKP
jgi:hypothetical protein